jgi:hypothetical protein
MSRWQASRPSSPSCSPTSSIAGVAGPQSGPVIQGQVLERLVEGFGAKHRPLEERLRQLDEEVPRLQGEIDYLKMSLLNQADVLSEAHDLYHRFGDLPFEDRRAIVEAIVERITIGGEEIELALAALRPFPKMTAFGQRTPGVVCTFSH